MRTTHETPVAAAGTRIAVRQRQQAGILIVVWGVNACHALRSTREERTQGWTWHCRWDPQKARGLPTVKKNSSPNRGLNCHLLRPCMLNDRCGQPTPNAHLRTRPAGSSPAARLAAAAALRGLAGAWRRAAAWDVAMSFTV